MLPRVSNYQRLKEFIEAAKVTGVSDFKIIGSRNERVLKKLKKVVTQVNNFEGTIEQLDDDALKESLFIKQIKTHSFRLGFLFSQSPFHKRNLLGINFHCATSKVCSINVASISAMKLSNTGGTGLVQYSLMRYETKGYTLLLIIPTRDDISMKWLYKQWKNTLFLTCC